MMEGETATSTEGSLESEPVPAERMLNPADGVNCAAVAAAAAVAAIPSAALASQASLERDGAKPEKPEGETYVSLQELFNRLFTAIVSTESESRRKPPLTADDQFVNTFFLVYRRFCQPRELMTEFLERFIEVEQYAVSRDIRLWALMKLAGALKDWATKYPGDLVDAETQALFRKTLGCMLKYTFLAHVTVDLVSIEQGLDKVVDLDQSWSCRPNLDEANLQTPETAAALELVVEKDGLLFEDEAASFPSTDGATPMKEKSGSTYSRSTASLTVDLDPIPPRSGDSSSEQSRSVYSNDESGHRKWSSAINALLHMEAQHFAFELTLMQWELFAAIRVSLHKVDQLTTATRRLPPRLWQGARRPRGSLDRLLQPSVALGIDDDPRAPKAQGPRQGVRGVCQDCAPAAQAQQLRLPLCRPLRPARDVHPPPGPDAPAGTP
jgi:hypothetical protein